MASDEDNEPQQDCCFVQAYPVTDSYREANPLPEDAPLPSQVVVQVLPSSERLPPSQNPAYTPPSSAAVSTSPVGVLPVATASVIAPPYSSSPAGTTSSPPSRTNQVTAATATTHRHTPKDAARRKQLRTICGLALFLVAIVIIAVVLSTRGKDDSSRDNSQQRVPCVSDNDCSYKQVCSTEQYCAAKWVTMGSSDLALGVGTDEYKYYTPQLSQDGQTLLVEIYPYSGEEGSYVGVYQYNETMDGWNRTLWVTPPPSSDASSTSDSTTDRVTAASLSGDGRTVAVGMSSSSVQIYRYLPQLSDDAPWLAADVISSITDVPVLSVSINHDGTVLVVGTADEAVHVFSWSSSKSTWMGSVRKTSLYGGSFGHAVALSGDGLTLAVGAPNAARKDKLTGRTKIRVGYVTVYARTRTTPEYEGEPWGQTTTEELSNWEQVGGEIWGQIRYQGNGEWVSLSHNGSTMAFEGGGLSHSVWDIVTDDTYGTKELQHRFDDAACSFAVASRNTVYATGSFDAKSSVYYEQYGPEDLFRTSDIHDDDCVHVALSGVGDVVALVANGKARVFQLNALKR